MPWQLVIRVTLEDISASQQKLSNNFQMTTVGRQVQRGPLVYTSRRIHVKFFLALSEEIVELGDRLYTLLLALSHGCMHWCPIISILQVWPSSVENERLCDVLALL